MAVRFGLDLATGTYQGNDSAGPSSLADAIGLVLEPRARKADRLVDYLLLRAAPATLQAVLNVRVATVTIGGVGCPGTGNLTPAIGSVGLPAVGTVFTVTLADARPSTFDLLVFSFTGPTFIGTPLGTSTCSLFPPDPVNTLLRFTDPTGADSYPIAVPASLPGGIGVMLQWAVFDPNGAFQSVLAMSDALHMSTGL